MSIKNKKNPFKSLFIRLPLLFVASVIVIMVVVIPLVYQRFHSRMIDQYTRMAEGVTRQMVNAFDGDKVEEFMEKNFDLPEYVETVDFLYSLRDNYPDILYMYIYRFEADGGHVVIDLDADWVENGEGYEPGSIYETEEPFTSHLEEVMAGKQIAGYSELTEEDGYLFTYTRPIFRSDGSYACTAAVDFSMDRLTEMDRDFTIKLALILLGIGMLVLVFDFIIIRRRITEPINKLSQCAEKFSYDTEEDRKRNLELLDAVNIHTGDEIEDVYHMIQSVTHDSFHATDNLLRAQEGIRERDGMITAMAADYRSIYYANLDKDECLCVRATEKLYEGKMWEGKSFHRNRTCLTSRRSPASIILHIKPEFIKCVPGIINSLLYIDERLRFIRECCRQFVHRPLRYIYAQFCLLVGYFSFGTRYMSEICKDTCRAETDCRYDRYQRNDRPSAARTMPLLKVIRMEPQYRSYDPDRLVAQSFFPPRTCLRTEV